MTPEIMNLRMDSAAGTTRTSLCFLSAVIAGRVHHSKCADHAKDIDKRCVYKHTHEARLILEGVNLLPISIQPQRLPFPNRVN
jgi:hypothetical protein